MTLAAAAGWVVRNVGNSTDLPYEADFSDGWQRGDTPHGGAISQGDDYQLATEATYLLWRSAR